PSIATLFPYTTLFLSLCMTIDINYTAYRLKAGHQLRVSIAGSNAPHYDVNQNNGQTSRTSITGEPAYETIYHGESYPSKVIIPVDVDYYKNLKRTGHMPVRLLFVEMLSAHARMTALPIITVLRPIIIPVCSTIIVLHPLITPFCPTIMALHPIIRLIHPILLQKSIDISCRKRDNNKQN